MKHTSRSAFTLPLICLILLAGCSSSRKILQDEVRLHDGSTVTGTLSECDSSRVVLQKLDLSQQIIPWTDIDSVGSVSHKTRVLSFHTGCFSTPYYSVFRNENHTPVGGGFQIRYGTARWGKTYRYVALAVAGGKPYGATKLGLGVQRYFFSRYTHQFSFSGGLESSLMFIRDNNAPQLTLEPYCAGEYKLLEQLHLSARFGIQKNLMSLNHEIGVNLCVGANFLFRNFRAHYQYICRQRQLPRRFNP